MLKDNYTTKIISKEDLLSAITDENNKLIPKRCSEKYLTKHNLLDSLIFHAPIDFETIKEKIYKLYYDGGYCMICGKRTKIDSSLKKFRDRCEEHRFVQMKRISFDDIVPDTIKELYEQGTPISKLAKDFKFAHQTIKQKLLSLGVILRKHSDNQTIQANKNKKELKFGFTKDFWLKEYKNKTTPQIANELQCCETTVLNMLRVHDIEIKPSYRSSQENKICEFLDSLEIEYIKNGRTFIGKELDIHIPKYNLNLEINGIYWHSTLFKDKDYHLNKTIECEAKNTQLLHFWDKEIDNQFEIVKSLIKAKCKIITNKIYARECVVKQINNKEAKEFTDNTHLQGHCNASLYLGLFYKDELISVSSFSKPRFNKTVDTFELIRYSTKLNTIVIGGLSKIIKYVKTHNNNCSILSYANRRWTALFNNAYSSCGFDLINITKPNYFYTKDFRVLYNRVKFQKHKLKHLDNYADDKTENEIMVENGYSQIYDCGNLTYFLK